VTAPGVEEELRVELDRVSTRIRILARRRSPDGARSPDIDEGPDPVGTIRAVLQRMADLAADAEGEPRRRVPELDPNALADQLLTLTQDLMATTDPVAQERGRQLLEGLRRDL
jgi:hypothetical protein